MIEEAEKYQEQDEAKQETLKEKTNLEQYLYKVTKTLKKSDVKKNMPKEMSDALLDEIEEIMNWCEDHPEEKAEVYEAKRQEFEMKAELKIAPFRVFDGDGVGGILCVDDFKPYMELENGAIVDKLDVWCVCFLLLFLFFRYHSSLSNRYHSSLSDPTLISLTDITLLSPFQI